jgi:hypothetical protein
MVNGQRMKSHQTRTLDGHFVATVTAVIKSLERRHVASPNSLCSCNDVFPTADYAAISLRTCIYSTNGTVISLLSSLCNLHQTSRTTHRFVSKSSFSISGRVFK